MTRRAIVACRVIWVVVCMARLADAQGVPNCRVRLVRSAATEMVSAAVVLQVAEWVDARDKGCRLVSTIDEADVLLEFSAYKQTASPDGVLADVWLFVARRLSEPDRERATYRFGYTTLLGAANTKAHVARALPIALADVCLGYLPKTASTAEP